MQLYIFGLVLMVWPSMSHTTWSSWEEEMEEALHNLNIELDKVEQRRILQEGAQEVRELAEIGYSKDDLSIVASDANSDRRMIRGNNDSRGLSDVDADPKYQAKSVEECKEFQIIFKSNDVHFHTPDGCVGYEIDHDNTVCDTEKGVYPMTCTFHQHLNSTIELDEVLRHLSSIASDANSDSMTDKLLKAEEKNQDIFAHRHLKRRGRRTKQQQWVAKAAKKQSEGETEGACRPASHGRSVRGMDCDLCWGWVPYPCNCNCRGWTQHSIDCWRPCSHYNDEYTQTLGLYCVKPCDREGQIALNVGCGLTPADRTCVKSSGDCIMKYINHAISILDVLTSILSGGVASAFKTAAKTAAKATTLALAKTALRKTLKDAGQAFAKSLMSSKAIQKKMRKYKEKFGKDLKDQVVEQGSELFVAASMNTEPDWGGMIDEIAEALDPTGIYSLVKGFIPPESCDDTVFMPEDIPDEEWYLPIIDILDLVESSGGSSDVVSLPNKYFPIRNLRSGMALDIPGGNCARGTNLITWKYHGGDNQLFYFGTNGSIMSKKCNLALDVKGGCANGENLIIWPAHGGKNQVFDVRDNGSIISAVCGKAIDMYGSNSNGRNLNMWSYHGGWNQIWKT